jgi:hypothetical protein
MNGEKLRRGTLTWLKQEKKSKKEKRVGNVGCWAKEQANNGLPFCGNKRTIN